MRHALRATCLVLGIGSGLLAGPAPDDLGRTDECMRPIPGYRLPARGRRRFAQARSAPVDSVIRDDFCCNDDTAGGTRQEGPSIAIDQAGNLLLAWYDFRDGNADAWFQLLDPAGNPVGPNRRMNTDVTMGWQGDPAVSRMGDGVGLASWEDRRDWGNSDLFCQRFDSTGAALGDNFRISDSAAAGDQMVSGCHLNPMGASLVAWDDRRNGITGDIYAQFLNPDGSPLGSNFRVNDDPVGQANQYEPCVTGDDSGRFVVAWMDGRGLNAYDWNIFLQRFDSNCSRSGANVQVTTNDSIQWAPAIASAGSGATVVLWEDHRRGQGDVYGQFYSASGQPIGGNVRVHDDAGSANQQMPEAAANRYGEYLAVWADYRNGAGDIYGQRFDASGSPLGANFLISDGPGGTDQFAPSAVASADGGYWVGWIDARSGNGDAYLRRLDRSGTPAGAGRRVNDDGASSHQRVSSIGMLGSGRSVVAWEDERSGGTDIYACVLDQAGRPLGANRRLNSDGGGASQYYAAVGCGQSLSLVAWTDNRSGAFDICAQYLDEDGAPVGSNFVVNSDTQAAHQWYPYVAMDSSNRAAVIWMDTRVAGYAIMCRLYDAVGAPIGPEFRVSDDSGGEYYASVARNASGRTAVAWMDGRGGDMDIYCQLLEANGGRVGPNFKVNDDSGHYHGYPACAITDDGMVAVAWEDTRSERYEVFIQWFDSSGGRLGGNERVNDNSQPADCYSPSCAYAPDGRLAVLFNDERGEPGMPEIYCQRFWPDRGRISGNRQLNLPASFPGNVHWTVGQSIAASGSRVVAAWTDNRRHQGWDIFAKVTDWDLVGIAGEVGWSPAGPWLAPSIGRVFRVRTAVPAQSRITVFDCAGRVVSVARLPAGTARLDLGALRPGVYVAALEPGGRNLRQKLIVR